MVNKMTKEIKATLDRLRMRAIENNSSVVHIVMTSALNAAIDIPALLEVLCNIIFTKEKELAGQIPAQTKPSVSLPKEELPIIFFEDILEVVEAAKAQAKRKKDPYLLQYLNSMSEQDKFIRNFAHILTLAADRKVHLDHRTVRLTKLENKLAETKEQLAVVERLKSPSNPNPNTLSPQESLELKNYFSSLNEEREKFFSSNPFSTHTTAVPEGEQAEEDNPEETSPEDLIVKGLLDFITILAKATVTNGKQTKDNS